MRKKKVKNSLTPLEQLKALVAMTVVTSQQQKEERDDLYRSLLDTLMRMDKPRDAQVVHPDYYRKNGKETIDKICYRQTPLGAYLFSIGNVQKYEDRAPYKGDFFTDNAKGREYAALATKYFRMITPTMHKHWRAIQEEWKEIRHESM